MVTPLEQVRKVLRDKRIATTQTLAETSARDTGVYSRR